MEQRIDKHSSLVNTAAEHADRFGFSVIPVRPDKKPYIKWEEFQTRRATREEIIRWWKGQRKNPRHKNIRDRAAHPTRPVSCLTFPDLNTGRNRRRSCISLRNN
jgi:hypothetical protein